MIFLLYILGFFSTFLLATEGSINRFWKVQNNVYIESHKDPSYYLLLEGTSNPYQEGWEVLDSYVPTSTEFKGRYTFSQPIVHPNYFYRVSQIAKSDAANRNSDGDIYSDIEEITHVEFLKVGRQDSLPTEMGRRLVEKWADFEAELTKIDSRGAYGAPVLRFVIVGIQTERPILYILGKRYGHGTFVSQALKFQFKSDENFQQLAYENLNKRHFLTGYIAHHENFVSPSGKRGALAFQYWPGDLPPFEWVQVTDRLIKEALAFPEAEDSVYYFPSSIEQHRKIIGEEKALFESSEIKVLDPDILFNGVEYQPYLYGEAVGKLVKGTSGQERYGRHDIVVFESVPSELNRVAGIITQSFQTPLSHVSLRAQQDSIPNAMVTNALSRVDVQDFLGKWVVYRVEPGRFSLLLATEEEIQRALNSGPDVLEVPEANLTVKTIPNVQNIVFKEGAKIYGAKATNLGELRRMKNRGLIESEVPDARAIPFYFYHAFMQENGLYDLIRSYMNQSLFQESADYRDSALATIRDSIKKGAISTELRLALNAMVSTYPAGTVLRFRSSTNNEDLPDFSGAGLYDSYTHHIGEPKPGGGFYSHEGHVSKTVKQVWASLWNFRAFEERESYGIDHFKIFMGVLVHPNFADESVNGVAATFDPFDGVHNATYVNAMEGEELVTGADGSSRFDEFVVSPNDPARAIDPNQPYRISVRQFFSTTQQLLMTDAHIYQLHLDLFFARSQITSLLREIDPGHPSPMLEVEFKVVGEGEDAKIWIKQIRPYLGF